VVEELDLILSDRDDVAVRCAFTETPGQVIDAVIGRDSGFLLDLL
jgi:hypothetical protein